MSRARPDPAKQDVIAKAALSNDPRIQPRELAFYTGMTLSQASAWLERNRVSA